ncbi:MAG: class II aldolase/adducin family protein [Acidimicrobiaceae bacterium]|nr:class II aldolase/adducin family protein [Acidimicrobiaceae bacterium]
MSQSTLSHISLRNEVVEAAKVLFGSGVMSRTGHANLSAKVGDDAMLLTMDGNVRDLTVDRLALVALDGTILDGDLDPTNAEIVRMHSEVYEARPAVGAIIHTHSPNLLAFALANRELSIRYEALLRFGQAVNVPVVPWAPRGSERSVRGILDTLTKHVDTSAVILGNHGVLVFGSGPLVAAGLLTVLEEAAEAEISAERIGGAVNFPVGALADVRAAMESVRA